MTDVARIGYALCFSEADATTQRLELERLGCLRVYVDIGVTLQTDTSPELVLAVTACRCGDTLVVTSLDRLGPTLRDIHATLTVLKERNVDAETKGKRYDWSDPISQEALDTLGDAVDAIRSLYSRRSAEGKARAKTERPSAHRGRRGRPRKLSDQRQAELRLLAGQGSSPASLAALFGISVQTVQRILGSYQPAGTTPEH